KPVHRRILFASQEGGFVAGRPYRKSAKIVGDVMGNYHPHGDSAIYDALARMTQDWSLRVPLVDGQGNFGSMDPDPPASMRYTEARLAKVANALLDDLDKDTVDFAENYDGSRQEPQVLPARFPNLLVNGAGGIAVGMATNVPPHNLGEVIDGCFAFIDNPAITSEELFDIIPGPDFPTSPLILGQSGARAAYTTGRGSILMRCRHEIETKRGDRESIVLTSIPFQVGKSNLVEKLAEAAKEKRIEGVADIRDESNRLGMRVVVDLKRDATAEVVLNQIWRHTPAQSSFPANMLAIRGGRPETLMLRDIIQAFIAFREEVITRRTKFELNKARDRAHTLLGLVVAVSNLDEVVAMIRGAPNPAAARATLREKRWPIGDIAQYIELIEAIEPTADQEGGTYQLSERQVKAILELRLHRLTALGRDEIGDELKALATDIGEYLSILADRRKLYGVLRDELQEIRDAYATPRLSEIAPAWDGLEDEDLIERDEMVVTVTLDGYIKRTPLSTFRAQNRGGKGRAGMATKEEDAISEMFVTSTHNPVLFFSTSGKVYRMKVWKLPEGGPTTRGRPIINLLPSLDSDETIRTVLPLPEDEDSWGTLNVVFATKLGNVRRNSMDSFANIPSNGKLAMRFDDASKDRLIGVALLEAGDDVLLATKLGRAIRFGGEDIREFQSRTSTGVRGMKLKPDDEVVSLSILHGGSATPDERDAYLKLAPWKADEDAPTLSGDHADMADAEEFILTVCANGYGKLSSAYEYRRAGRGGQGITNIDNIDRNGSVVASFTATKSDQLMLVTDQAKLIRISLDTLRVIGRASAGVRLFNVDDKEQIDSVAKLDEDETPENEAEELVVEEMVARAGGGDQTDIPDDREV
ncbi:MAG: DNA gyrase subunit A, partial [Pontixanthobacter sp.]